MESDLSNLGRKARVLVADGDAANRELIEEVCRAEGFEPRGVTTGHDVIAALKQEAFDLLMLDASMPDIPGLEVCRIIKSDPPMASIPIIIVTASTDETVRERAAALGVFETIGKPFRVFELVQRMRRAMRPRSRTGDPPTAPRIKLRRGRIDLLSGLPSPRTLRARLQREIDACAAAGRTVACAVVRLENEGKLRDEVGRSLTDALLGELSAALLESFPDGVIRGDLDELCVILPEDQLVTLGTVVAEAPAAADVLEVPTALDIQVRWGARVAAADRAHPDTLLDEARRAVDVAERAGQASHIERETATPPDSTPET